MGSIQRNRLTKLGENRCGYLDINGIPACISATLFLNIEEKTLVLDLTKIYKKPLSYDPEYKDHYEHIGYFRVGTLHKPERRKIIRALSINKPKGRSFSTTEWKYKPEGFGNLNAVLTYATEGNNNIARALKLSEIKQKLKSK